MSSSPCNSSALASLLGALTGSGANARFQSGQLADVAREARSMAVSSNSFRSSPHGTVGFGSRSSGEFIQGIRNRLFLKYSGIDYEFYNFFDMRYREEV